MSEFRKRFHKKKLPYNATDLQFIEETLKRKWATQSNSQIIPPLEEPIYPVGSDNYIPPVIPSTTLATLGTLAGAYTTNLMLSGSSANVGVILNSKGPNLENVYRVDANNQGFFGTNVNNFMNPIKGQMSLLVRSHDVSGSGTVNTVMDVGGNLVVRYESGTSTLRLYPNLATHSGTYMSVSAADWWSSTSWKEVVATWDYPNQEWALSWGGVAGSQTGSDTIKYPEWDVFTLVSFLADNANTTNIYQDTCFLNVGAQAGSGGGGASTHTDLTDMPSSSNEDHDGRYPTRVEWNQNGFDEDENHTDATLTWTDTTPDRTLSIQPTATNFNYWIAGVKYTSTGDTVQITNVEGIHVIYYDGSTLTALANPTSSQVNDCIFNKALVSIVYWDVSAAEAIYVGEERHYKCMSPSTHSYLHFLEGLRYNWGLGLNTMSVDGTGVTADAQFGIDAGAVSDEDMYLPISAVASTTGLPIFYMLGASAEWTRYINAGFSVRTYDGTSADRLAFNEYTGGAWQLTEESNGDFVLYHIFATTEKDNPMISIMGQNGYATKNQARDGAKTEVLSLVLNNILFPEIRPIATVIYQTKLSYANTVNARIVSTDDGDDYIDWRNETVSRTEVSTTNHGSLTGRGADDHPIYPPLTVVAMAAPTVNDDGAAGYRVGYIWVQEFTDKTFICSDVTTGAAVWTEITQSGGGNVSNTGTPVNKQIAIWTDATTIKGDADFTYDGSSFHLDGGAVFNESGAQVNFRVESDTLSDAFYVDGRFGNIGLGTDRPKAELHMVRDDAITFQMDSYISTAALCGIHAFNRSRGTEAKPTVVSDDDRLGSIVASGWGGTGWVNAAQIVFNVDDSSPAATDMGGEIVMLTTPEGNNAPVESVRVYNDGIVDLARQSRVRAVKTSAMALGGTPGVVIYNVDSGSYGYDEQDEYKTTTGRFQAAKTGYYAVKAAITATAASVWGTNTAYMDVYKNGSFYASLDSKERITAGRRVVIGGTTDVYLAAGDYIEIMAWASTATIILLDTADNGRHNFLCVHKLS